MMISRKIIYTTGVIAFLLIGVVGIIHRYTPKASKPVIRLVENPWMGGYINAYVAKIILHEKMGYPVEMVKVDENVQWALLAKGELDASLEVWPSGHIEDIKKYIVEQKTVQNMGLLGVVGKIGWYIPTYMVEKHPSLATWVGFKDPNLVALFKTAATGDKGQFLTGDPSWVQYDREIIKNLGLKLKVIQLGSEEALLRALDAAYKRKEPILFYFWTPHSAQIKYRLTQVALPKCQCRNSFFVKVNSGNIDCEYPPDILCKIASSGLKQKAPDVYYFLKSFSYTTEDQVSMITMVTLEGKSVEEAARIWVEKNANKWKYWIPVK
ncbi:MAG: ABC transporter substrate-binding protein [Smithella sp.]